MWPLPPSKGWIVTNQRSAGLVLRTRSVGSLRSKQERKACIFAGQALRRRGPEPVAVLQSPVNGLGVPALAQRQFDQILGGGLAGTARRTAPRQRDQPKSRRHRWPVLSEFGRRRRWEGRGNLIGRFCRCLSPPPSGRRNGDSGCSEASCRRIRVPCWMRRCGQPNRPPR